MIRFNRVILVYALLLAGLMLALTARALPAYAAGDALGEAPPTLNRTIAIERDVVQLGDLFNPAGKYADRPVARAPAPGETITLDAMWLWRLARSFGVDWRPTTQYDAATVTRPSRAYGPKDLRAMVRRAYFEETGEDSLIAIDLDDETAELHLAADADGEPRVTRFSLDPTSGRFTAEIAGPAGSAAAQRVLVAGRAVRQVEVYAPAVRLGAGRIIRAQDLEVLLLPESQVSRTALVHRDDLIGKEIARTVTAGRPIPASSVRAPQLVQRGAPVTVELATANMRLTAQGRALEPGAKGDLVRVQNLQSRITIDAVVVGANRVRVFTPDRMAARAALAAGGLE